jgi:glycosyltransferase involved in cell wall biosynthesis
LNVKFSIIVPAHNEERFLPACLESIEQAAVRYPGEVEVIVVLNRCTDATERIARQRGAKVVREDARSLAGIRNAGAKQAAGEILVTIDADSRMSPNVLDEIDRALATGKYVGGGVPIRPERTSLGIMLSFILLEIALLATRLAAGLFWCLRRDFEAIGGFNEKLPCAEDHDFAKRLRAHGRKQGRKFTTLRSAHIVTSCRKFDHFGDWHVFSLLLLNARKVYQGLRGEDLEFPNRYYYDFNPAQQDDPADTHKPCH